MNRKRFAALLTAIISLAASSWLATRGVAVRPADIQDAINQASSPDR